MSIRRALTGIALPLLLSSACQKGQPHPSAVGASAATFQDRWAELNQKLAVALREAGKDCDKVAQAVEAFQSAHGKELRPLYQQVSRWADNVDPKVSHEYETKIGDDSQVRVDAAALCAEHPGAQAAFEVLYQAVGWSEEY